MSFKNTDVKILTLKWFGTKGVGSVFIVLVKSWWLKGGLCLGIMDLADRGKGNTS